MTSEKKRDVFHHEDNLAKVNFMIDYKRITFI